ncbi:MAG: hypothetical protein AB8B65_12045 [Kordia sp.]|uniref:hypothetical protein n=1 Tax=Kordia sp. TaxID=1965332 RepID=UPI0038589CDE
MRTELETIAYIEKYLLNVLTDAETNQFETRMATDPIFKNDVELQEQLMQSLERISLQNNIQDAAKTYKFWKLLKIIGMFVITLVIALSAWYFINASAESSIEAESIPTKVEQHVQEKQITQKKVVSVPDTIPKKKTSIKTQSGTTVFAENTVVDPLEEIQSEVFSILTEKDTIVETQSGIVFLIPENAFVDANQNVVNGNIQLEVKEAVDSHTIMTAGLSTLFNDKPLETGGMFFIEATSNGEKLHINPEKEITADIPTQNYKEGMQLFDGEKAEDGTINWTNPKPLNTALIPEDIYSLNFYPPAYLETLSKKGYDRTDKKFTDSLYYSFAKTTSNALSSDKINFSNKILGDIIPRDTIIRDVIITQKDTVKVDDLLTPVEEVVLGLDPLKVKTIWNERYQNTFIATKAFEERLRVIHQNCESANSIFDVYVQNLDRNLYEVDEMIVTRYKYTSLREQFEFFAAQKLTNVPNVSSEVSKLNAYYIQQQKVYRLALEKSQRKMDSLLSIDKKYQAFSKQQLQNYYQNELAITTAKVAKDLGARLPRRFNQTRSNRTQISRTNTVSNEVSTKVTSVARTIQKEKRKRIYRAPIRTTGWKNIDRILNEDVVSSVKSRTTTTVKTKEKSVTISYSEYEVLIENTERFDKLFVYLVPTKFNSFVRLNAENGRFTYKLNDLLKYRVHCIGYLNAIPFYIDKTIRNASDKLKLRKITVETLRKRLSNLNNQNSSLETEVLYQASRKTNQIKLKKHRELIKLKRAIESVVFPCQRTETLKTLVNDVFEAEPVEVMLVEEPDPILSFELVETVPIFPGCETFESTMERKKCMSEKIEKFIQRNLDMEIMTKNQQANTTRKIQTMFEINTSGLIQNIQVRTNFPDMETEVKRVIQSLPKMTPAKQKGRTVSVKYVLPIFWKVD